MKNIFLCFVLLITMLFSTGALVQANSLLEGGKITFRSGYFYDDLNSEDGSEDISVNAFGAAIDLVSGYAWDTIGFDFTGSATLASGTGQSEITAHDYETNEEKNKAVINTAALKLKFGNDSGGATARGGYTRLDVGTIGTSWRMNSHAYRGFETKLSFGNFQIGYAWADQFLNEWDDQYRDMTNNYFQNREPYAFADKVDYIHSVGIVYNFGHNDSGYVDTGYGQGKDFRDNAELAISVPILTDAGTITLAAYGFWGKYNQELYKKGIPEDEYHYTASVELKRDEMSALLAFAYTEAPNSGEMSFSLVPYSNADKRTFSAVRAQLDEHAWDGLKTVKAAFDYDIGALFGVPNLVIGASVNYGYDLIVPEQIETGTMLEVDYFIEYSFEDTFLKGLTVGVFPAHLRTNNFYNGSYGKPDMDDIQVDISYKYVFGQNLL